MSKQIPAPTAFMQNRYSGPFHELAVTGAGDQVDGLSSGDTGGHEEGGKSLPWYFPQNQKAESED